MINATDIKTFIANLTSANVVSVYSGRSGCCCGCRGNYRHNSAHVEADQDVDPEEISDRSVKTLLKKVQKAAQEFPVTTDEACPEYEVTVFDNIVSFSTETRTQVLYLTENGPWAEKAV